MQKVVITGRGIVSSLGNSVKEYLDGLRNNATGIRPIHWPTEPEPGWFGAVHDFDPTRWMNEKVIDGTDIFAQFALAAGEQARADSGLAEFDEDRTGVVVGTSMGGTRSLSEAQRDYEQHGAQGVSRKMMLRILTNMAGSQLAMRYSLHGPLLTVATACASSIDAIGNATRLIRLGEADVVLTGGSEAVSRGDGDFAPAYFIGQARYGMLSASKDPRRTLTPFDKDRTGIVIGDGSAMFVIESEEHARARGARILAEIVGYAALADGPHPSAPDPSGKWEATAMRKALANAGVDPTDVGALYAHATGTPKGDEAEIRAINAVHGGRGLPVTGIKGHTGHTGAASGAMSIISALETFESGLLPNAAGTETVDPEVDFRVITQKPAQVEADFIQVNAFGFGGQNASMVLRRPSA